MDAEKHGSHSKHEAALATQRASSMLLLFSVFLLVEGVVRVISVAPTPTAMWNGSSTTFPPIVLLVAAVVEVWFSLFGIVVAAASLFLDMRSVGVCIALSGSILCGWFTFVCYTIAAPAFTVDKAMAGGLLTLPQLRAATTFGEILASISWCFVMQGSQFYLSLSLMSAARNQNSGILEYNTKAKQKTRLMVYSGVVALGGIGILVLGALLRSTLGKGGYSKPQVFPPNVVLYPEMTIVSGILVFLYGAQGVMLAIGGMPSLSGLAAFGLGTWLWLINAHILGQLGLIGMPVAGPGAQLACLATSLIIMPLFFAAESCRTDSEYDHDAA